ncbi:sugar-binding protein [Cohnella fermenti]|nr:sugar-binding protein [Cohnella fermenti]
MRTRSYSASSAVALLLAIVLLFSAAAGGYPSAVYGEQLEALSDEGAQAETASWEQFRSGFGSHDHALALEAGADEIVIDGSLDEWDGYAELQLPAKDDQIQMSGWGGPSDVSASVYLAYDDDFFYWAAAVTDDIHEPIAGSTMWRGDSIQFAFGLNGEYGPEYGINYMDGQANIWQFSEGQAAVGADQITAAAVRSGNETVYEVKMPWTAIAAGKPEADLLPFTLLVNDNDGAGRRGWLEWTQGIGKAKNPELHGQVHLIPADREWSFWVEGPRQTAVDASVSYSVYAANWEDEPRTLNLTSVFLGEDREVTIPAASVAHIPIPFTATEPGTYELDFALSDPASEAAEQWTLTVDAAMTAADVEAMLDATETKLPLLEQWLTECEALGLSTDYERVNYTVIQDFIAYGKEDIAQGRLSRAYYVALELEKLYDEAAAELQASLDGSRTPAEVPRYVTGPVDISGYSFVGDTQVRSTGVVETRPIIFTGYGAFTQVRKDVPKLQDLGANVIQIELGPRDVILDKTDYINQYSVSRAGGVVASAAVTDDASRSGNASLKITNSSPFQSNVYFNVGQTIAVEPNTTYEFKVWVKGENAKNTWFPGGSGMKQRKSFPSGTYDWREVEYEYTTGAAETSYKLLVVSENVGTIWIDDLSVTKAGSDINLVSNPGFEDLGGYSEDKEYVVSTQKIHSDIEKVLQNAEEHDVAVNLLISPHYFPDWALAKWPELSSANNGFIKFSLFQPMAQEIIEDYLRALIPIVSAYDSLHSITLSNESVYQANKDPNAAGAWHAYLAELYAGGIGELNDAYQSNYAAFAEVPMPDNVTASVRSYDYVLFNQDYFAKWHEWMADIIHELAPDLPVQAKIMGDPQGSLAWGVDIERFSEFSQINGNDNWNYINEGPKGFMEELSFYDLQASLKEAPVFNSEHHIIADGDSDYSPQQAKHLRSVLWQSAIHGRSGSAIWVWERTYDASSSREGSILHRPDVVAEAGKTNLDLNRLSLEITAFQNERPQAAILHSTASGIFSGDYWNARLRSYEALSYSGYKAGFVSEKQVAEGGLEAYELLIVPAASRVDPATLSGIQSFMEQGGRVLLVGSHSLELEPRGAAQSAADRNYVFAHAAKLNAETSTASQIRDALQPILGDIDPQHVTLKVASSGELPYNVEWRSVELDGRRLLNIVNYGDSPVTVEAFLGSGGNAPIGGFADLIAGETLAGTELTLEPLTPYLLEFAAASEEEPEPCL